MARNNNREALGTQNIKSLVMAMAIPTIVANLVSTIYSLVDTYFVSQLGTNATAAVGVNLSLERLINLFAMLVGSGACSYIARLLGMGRKKNADEVMSTSLFVGMGLGTLMLVVGKIFLSPLVDLLGATADCKIYSMQYGQYVLYAAPFMVGSFVLNMCLRSEGNSQLAMIGMAVGGILNCFLDPLFIFKFGLGVAGASMATAISKVVSFVILIWPYMMKKTQVEIALKHFVLRMSDVKEVVLIGMSSFLRSILGVIASICLNRAAGAFSTSALAAISVSNRVMMFPFSALLGFGQGFQPVCGFNWGAKKYRRVKESLDFSMKVALVGGIVIGGVIFLLAKPFIGLFNASADPDIIKYGVLALRLESSVLFIHGLGVVVNMYYAGIGKALEATLMSTARQGYCFIPLLYILPVFLGVYGLCAAQFAADIVSLAILVPLFIKGSRILKEKVAEEEAGEAA